MSAVANEGPVDERARRIAKVEALRELGRDPYPVRYDRTHTAVEVHEHWEHLEAGDCVAIYPEGTRTHDGRLGEVKGGALLYPPHAWDAVQSALRAAQRQDA